MQEIIYRLSVRVANVLKSFWENIFLKIKAFGQSKLHSSEVDGDVHFQLI